MEYTDYVHSEHWKKLKTEYYSKKEKICKICGNNSNIHLHHRRYRDLKGNILFRERFHELYPLCSSCHITWHNIYKTSEKMNISKIMRIRRLLASGVKKEYAFQLSTNGNLYRLVLDRFRGRGAITHLHS